ncbi:hypothetical protein EX30DRAFT_223059 [Ascodesmis nigricans]|uniref:Uncharacterized protein n=1 Tax=Ascodesmis nigricans TaxID=341454 RepID=A0A4S2MJ86_9PEZI|nr:hypothetical protein EX30DRAFT_223059 [Ascodesmis nigricans]
MFILPDPPPVFHAAQSTINRVSTLARFFFHITLPSHSPISSTHPISPFTTSHPTQHRPFPTTTMPPKVATTPSSSTLKTANPFFNKPASSTVNFDSTHIFLYSIICFQGQKGTVFPPLPSLSIPFSLHIILTTTIDRQQKSRPAHELPTNAARIRYLRLIPKMKPELPETFQAFEEEK